MVDSCTSLDDLGVDFLGSEQHGAAGVDMYVLVLDHE